MVGGRKRYNRTCLGYNYGMTTKITSIIIWATIIISFLIGIYLYPQLPDEMASHWNTKGEVDSYMDKFAGVFVFPIFLIFVYIIFTVIPRIDPLKKNIEKFRKYYNQLILLVILFFLYIYGISLLWNLGVKFSMNGVLTPAFAILIFYIGVILKHTERNWFIGIRTPWTISSETVWKKTNNLGGDIFQVIGMVTAMGSFFIDQMMTLMVSPIILSVMFLFIYSYLQYRKEEK